MTSSRTTSKTQSEDVQRQIDSLQREFNQLEDRSSLTSVHETIGRIEERLAEYPLELKALENRGFLHSRPQHDLLKMLKGQWRKTRTGLKSSLKERQTELKSEARSTSRLVAQAKSGRASSVSKAENAVERLESSIAAAERSLRGQYGNVDSELSSLGSSLKQQSWMMDQLDESPEIALASGEGPLLAVDSQWHKDGDDGPEGVLFLTNQRLLFEQKEEVVTKKRFGIFKAESKMVQKLWLDINVNDIDSVEDSEEGGFLGIGKDDILELICSGNSPVSRA